MEHLQRHIFSLPYSQLDGLSHFRILNGMEMEFKFSVPSAAAFERLATISSVAGYRLSRPKHITIHDRYFDTSDLLIRKAGFGARIRSIESRLLLTLKGLGHADKRGLHVRSELEMPIVADSQECRLTAAKKYLPEKLRKLLGQKPLSVQFEVDTRRTIRTGTHSSGRSFELSLDISRFFTPGTKQKRYEVEIEAEEIGEAELTRVAEIISSSFELTPTCISKFEFGLSFYKKDTS